MNHPPKIIEEKVTEFELQTKIFLCKDCFRRNNKWLVEFVTQIHTQARVEERKKKEELAEALLDMYGQYCGDGHDFMSAGERTSTILELQGYATFDEAGRMQEVSTTKK